MVLRLQIRCRDEREVCIDIPVEGGRVIVGMAGEGLAVEAGAMPYAYGSAPGLADLSRTLLSEDPPSGFGAGAAGLPEEMPDDFGFVAEWGVARMNSLDTFEGTFTKDLVTGSPRTATTKLVLTSDEKQALYQALRMLEPWSYPSRFEPPYADVTAPGTEQMVTPALKYHLHLSVARMEKDIWWTDDNLSTVAGAVALRAWFRQVMVLVESRPEYKAMPEARGGYA